MASYKPWSEMLEFHLHILKFSVDRHWTNSSQHPAHWPEAFAGGLPCCLVDSIAASDRSNEQMRRELKRRIHGLVMVIITYSMSPKYLSFRLCDAEKTFTEEQVST